MFYDPTEWLEEASGQPGQPMPWTLPPTDCPPVEQHPWANHIIRLLIANGFLPAQVAASLELTVWSDCSGINCEMFSLGDLAAAMFSLMKLEVVRNLYFTCEMDEKCLEFAKLNHKPRHFSTAIEKRCFKTGKYWCDSCGDNHEMPTSGVDIYTGTFPCNPWTRRGKMTGMEHSDAKCLLVGIDTIIFLMPATFIIELGEMPVISAKAEVMSMINSINVKCARASYIIHDLKENISPSWAGYCVRRSRFFVIGWRSDVCSSFGPRVMAPLGCILDNPLRTARGTYFAFLGLPIGIDWSRVGAYPTSEELVYITASACTCGVNPLSRCPVHLCKCGKCGDNGVQCKWRQALTKYVVDEGLEQVVSSNSNTLTYVQVLEMHGKSGPRTIRARILTNLYALKVDAKPLEDTLMVADLSQNVGFGSVMVNGDVPTLTTKSHLHSFRAGVRLTTYHMAALSGLDTTKMNFAQNMTPQWFAHRVGLGVHTANFGMVLMGTLALPICRMLTSPGGE